MILKEEKANLFNDIHKTCAHVVIAHCVNDLGIASSGFVVPLFEEFPAAKKEYLSFKHELGDVSYVSNGPFSIFNMCAQTGIRSKSCGPRDRVSEKPGRYSALVKCLEKVKCQLELLKLTHSLEIHIPKICSDRAGLSWELVKELINEIWADYPVYVYYL